MSSGNVEQERLVRLLALVAKEDAHLRAVAERLFGQQGPVTASWLRETLSRPEGINRLESFGAKFARMQDTIVDKLLPELLKTLGERPAAAIDNLMKAERLGWLSDGESWIAMRRLCHKLVHEYIESVDEVAPVLERARRFTDDLGSAFRAMRKAAAKAGLGS